MAEEIAGKPEKSPERLTQEAERGYIIELMDQETQALAADIEEKKLLIQEIAAGVEASRVAAEAYLQDFDEEDPHDRERGLAYETEYERRRGIDERFLQDAQRKIAELEARREHLHSFRQHLIDERRRFIRLQDEADKKR